MIVEGMSTTQSRAIFGPKSADHANASNTSAPVLSIPLPEKVFVTSFFCPWGPTGSGSGSLLALGLRSRVIVLQLDFSEESAVVPASAHTLKEINHDGRVQCLAWDPRTDLCSRALRFATGGAKDVCVFSLTDAGEQVRTMAGGHTDYVNDISFQPQDAESGSGGEHLVASGSDDCSLLVHDCQTGRMIHSVAFGSPVMAVKWNPAEGSKLLAAEKGGVIHIFNMISFNPILSFDCGMGPLSSADWSLKNSLLVAAGIRSDVYVWNMASPSKPVERRSAVHPDGVRSVRFANTAETVFATAGSQPGYGVKVLNARTTHTAFAKSLLSSASISWHPRLDYLAIGAGSNVDLHRVPTK